MPIKGRVAIDVGANVGIWTRWLAHNYQTVHAIEPNPEAIKELKNGLPANVIVYEVAAWSSEKNLEFNLYVATQHTSAYFKDQFHRSSGPIGKAIFPAKALDAIISEKEPVDFIKIDTEGAEFEVLLGAQNLLARYSPRMVIEIHDPSNELKIEPWLSKRGYSVEMVRCPYFPEDSWMWNNRYWLIGRI